MTQDIGRQIGRTHCLISTYLRNPDEYNKKKDTGRRRTLTAHDERQTCRLASNSCLSLNQKQIWHFLSRTAPTGEPYTAANIIIFSDKKKFDLDGPME
ncbi:hypothetical protein ANCDUO_18606 [Ancylostoma duodenale]|uniref:Uncharacterized protein n=1 Tax=Ancylostoma duodenale TaxID=51022 RepID=A0A0C2FXE7_9BILA|nr:hypothetical protein ANCDUO_18606 [Ancylostoma duodenale]